MTMSFAPSVSAQASASDRKIVLRAGHVGGRNRRVDRPILRHRGRAGQRRRGDAAQVQIELDVAADAERLGDGARGLDLARVDLAVADVSAFSA